MSPIIILNTDSERAQNSDSNPIFYNFTYSRNQLKNERTYCPETFAPSVMFNKSMVLFYSSVYQNVNFIKFFVLDKLLSHLQMLTGYLNQGQVFGLAGLGVIFWGVGVLTIRYASHILFENDLRRVFSYISAIPTGFLIAGISEGLVGISSKHRLTSVAIMTVSALMLDGLAYMWFPTLYENPTLKKKNPPLSMALSRMGAGWLLWSTAIYFAIALFTS
jgi:hypothetical protein